MEVCARAVVQASSSVRYAVKMRLSIHHSDTGRDCIKNSRHHQFQAIRCFEYLIDPKKIAREEAKKAEERRKQNRGSKSYRFIDRTRLRVQGGSGGRGSMSIEMLNRKHFFRPDGGHGGNGGCVTIVADERQQTLNFSQFHHRAQDGTTGGSSMCHGANGKNRIIRVPVGVIVKRVLEDSESYDPDTGIVTREWSEDEMLSLSDFEDDDEEFVARRPKYVEDDESVDTGSDDYSDSEESNNDELLPPPPRIIPKKPSVEDGTKMGYSKIVFSDSDDSDDTPEREVVQLADLDKTGAHIMVARGGHGGLGTCRYRSRHGALPNHNVIRHFGSPQTGEISHLQLELKLIADIGLVGFPNAGKSSLLHAMSAASPAIAPYPFTTLHPLVGVIEYQDGFRVKCADIPGLIDGASTGRGQGHDFLRHIERTKALVYMVDGAKVDHRDPVTDLEILVKELSSYDRNGELQTTLLNRKALVLVNKVDLLHHDQIPEVVQSIKDASVRLGIQVEVEADVFGISAGVTGHNLGILSKALRRLLVSVEDDRRLLEEIDRRQREEMSITQEQ